MTAKRIVGVSPWSNPNYDLMKEAGIEWLRLGLGFPYKDRIGGEFTGRFTGQLEKVREAARLGFRIMGISPGAGVMAWREEDGRRAWRPGIPEWAGTPADDRYYETCEQACAEIGRLTAGLVEMWQVSNEMDIETFRGPLTPEQAARFMFAEARGLKQGNPQAQTGINLAHLDGGRWLYQQLYNRPDSPFDYAGIDGYFGSWQPGGPGDWIPVIEEIQQLTGRPVLVNEWGYSSLGGRPAESWPEGVSGAVCKARNWRNAWKGEHTPAVQAEYTRVGLKIFATYPGVLGSFFYNWGDDAVCYHCGQADCPAECGWGLIDSEGKPKPAYYALKETVRAYY